MHTRPELAFECAAPTDPRVTAVAHTVSACVCPCLTHAWVIGMFTHLHFNELQLSQRYGGTVTHMPPELIEDGKVYQQGDVYAFGIMMWEVRYMGGARQASMLWAILEVPLFIVCDWIECLC